MCCRTPLHPCACLPTPHPPAPPRPLPAPPPSAGFWYGLWGTLLTAYGFALGGLIDYLGEAQRLVGRRAVERGVAGTHVAGPLAAAHLGGPLQLQNG